VDGKIVDGLVGSSVKVITEVCDWDHLMDCTSVWQCERLPLNFKHCVRANPPKPRREDFKRKRGMSTNQIWEL
jgi:hypothetical protein